MTEFPENVLELVNDNLGGFNRALGLRFVKAAPEAFTAEVTIGESHHQPYGLVHGGVYAAMIETVCSTGAALSVFEEGKSAVGLENATAFLHAVRSGRLRCTARPVAMGRRSHVWEGQVRDDDDRLVATGRVRLMILAPGSAAAGETVALKDGESAGLSDRKGGLL